MEVVTFDIHVPQFSSKEDLAKLQTGEGDLGSKHPCEGASPVDTSEKSIQACSFLPSIPTDVLGPSVAVGDTVRLTLRLSSHVRVLR